MPAGTMNCIPEGMLGSVMENVDVNRDGTVDHYRFSIRNQFLHPDHPLGWIRKLTVAVDGAAIASAEMYFVVRGQWIGVGQLPTIADIWWQMREIAEIYVRSPGLGVGPHQVEVGFDVSLYAHTPSIDTEGKYPTLHQTLVAEMEVQP